MILRHREREIDRGRNEEKERATVKRTETVRKSETERECVRVMRINIKRERV